MWGVLTEYVLAEKNFSGFGKEQQVGFKRCAVKDDTEMKEERLENERRINMERGMWVFLISV